MSRISGDCRAKMPTYSPEIIYRLHEAHRAFGGTSNTDNPGTEPHATSPTIEAETEPHQPRVGAGKSAVSKEKL